MSTRWKWTECREPGTGRLTLLRLDEHDTPRGSDPALFAVRDDWTGYLTRTERGRSTLAMVAAAPGLADALAGLLDWCRDNTSPTDPNSPHDLLVNASAVLRAARGGGADA